MTNYGTTIVYLPMNIYSQGNSNYRLPPYPIVPIYKNNNSESKKEIFNTWIIVASSLYQIWLSVLIMLNIPTFFYLCRNINLLNFLLASYLLISFSVDLFTVTIALITSIKPPRVFKDSAMIALIVINVFPTVLFLIWLIKYFSIEISFGFIITSLIQVVLAIIVMSVELEEMPRYKFIQKN